VVVNIINNIIINIIMQDKKRWLAWLKVRVDDTSKRLMQQDGIESLQSDRVVVIII